MKITLIIVANILGIQSLLGGIDLGGIGITISLPVGDILFPKPTTSKVTSTQFTSSASTTRFSKSSTRYITSSSISSTISSSISSTTSSLISSTTSSSISHAASFTTISAKSSTLSSTTTSSTTNSVMTSTSFSVSSSMSTGISSTPMPTGSPGNYTMDDLCGVQNGGLTCHPENINGPCCSQYGYCGNTEDYCSPTKNCQSGCSIVPNSFQQASTTNPLPTSGYTQTKYCGSANNGLKCEPDGLYGPCCSKDGICGGGDDFCLPSKGCQNGCSIVSELSPAGCGDGFCDGRSETCFSCQSDCGTCDSKYIDNCQANGQIALTFDDGPSDNGPLLLETADKLGVKLTYFIIGNKLSNPEYQTFLKNVYAAGHAIASHTFTHPFMTHLTDNELRAELIKTDDAIFNVIGVRPLFIRNPYADTNSRVLALIESMGYQSIFTSLDTEDTVYGGTLNKHKILDNVKFGLNSSVVSPLTNSFVITQHETVIDSVNYLPHIVHEVQNRGYTTSLINVCRGMTKLYRNDICGDKICSGYLENCSTCPQDCGICRN